MKHTLISFLTTGLTLCLFAANAQLLPVTGAKKKAIMFNSSMISPRVMPDNIEQIEREAPFNGLTIMADGPRSIDGKNVPYSAYFDVFTPVPLDYQWLKPHADLLKKTKFKRLTDNFIFVSIRSRLPIDWFDDAAWAIVVQNFGNMARLAKEGGCKGILFDTEHYSAQTKMSYLFDPSKGKSWDEAWNVARKRGRQVMEAAGKEFPDMKTLVLMAFSYASGTSDSDDIYHQLQSSRVAMFIPFVNGLIEGLTDQMIFYDGNEGAGYRSASPADYMKSAVKFGHRFQRLLIKENAKKIPQIRLSNAIYLDAYFTVPLDSTWQLYRNVPLVDKKARLALFEKNFTGALEFTDEYVWVYGETVKWCDKKITPWRKWGKSSLTGTWDQNFPGVAKIIFAGCHPEEYLTAVPHENLAKNPGFCAPFNKAELQAPVLDHANCNLMDWNLYNTKSKNGDGLKVEPMPGKGFNGSDAVRITGAKGLVVLSQTIPCKPGERYFVTMKAMYKGKGRIDCLGFYQKTLDRWFWPGTSNLTRGLSSKVKPGEWGDITMKLDSSISDGIITVGYGSGISGQTAPTDEAYFSDVKVYRLNVLE